MRSCFFVFRTLRSVLGSSIFVNSSKPIVLYRAHNSYKIIINKFCALFNHEFDFALRKLHSPGHFSARTLENAINLTI